MQLLSSSTYLLLAKVGRIYYIIRYTRFVRSQSMLIQNSEEKKPVSLNL